MMKIWSTALAAGAMIASVICSSQAQAEDPPAPPAMMVGPLKVTDATPAPLQLSRSAILEAPPAKVFALVANPENWIELIPPVTAVKVNGKGGVGDSRRFTMQDGSAVTDVIRASSKPVGSSPGVYAWSAAPGNPYGLSDHLSALEFRPSDNGGTVLTFYVFFASRDAATADKMSGALGRLAEGLLTGVIRRAGGELSGSAYGSQKIVLAQCRTVDVAAIDVWHVVAEQWGQVDRWASVISHSEMKGKLGVGAVRSCSVPGAQGFKETMLSYDPGAMTLRYQPTEGMPPFVSKAVATWKVTKLSPDRSRVDITVELDLAEGTPLPAAGMVKHQFGQLVGVTGDDIKYFLEQGKPHPRKKMMAEKAGM